MHTFTVISVLCTAVPQPHNGHVTINNIDNIALANYTCDIGYTLVGETTLICQSGGTWSGPPPTCGKKN